MKKMLMPSMMCVNPAYLTQTIGVFENCGIDGLHIDVMDGHFVPNIQLGTDYCKYLRELSKLPFDYHLMVDEPETKISWFPVQAGDWVSVHVESTRHIQRAIDKIVDIGAKPIIALNPGTPLSSVEELIPQVDGILIMTVNPGYAGQKLIPYTIDKIRRLRELLTERQILAKIEVDGNVNLRHFNIMSEAGADMFVIGSSGFLKNGEPAAIEHDIKQNGWIG